MKEIFKGVFPGSYVVCLYHFDGHITTGRIFQVEEIRRPGGMFLKDTFTGAYGRDDRWRLATNEEIRWHLDTGINNINIMPKPKEYEIY